MLNLQAALKCLALGLFLVDICFYMRIYACMNK